MMRTTLTLESDVAAKLKRLVRRSHITFKEAVNRALRCGLTVLEEPDKKRKPYRTRARSLGVLPGIDYDKLGQLGDEMDDVTRITKSGG